MKAATVAREGAPMHFLTQAAPFLVFSGERGLGKTSSAGPAPGERIGSPSRQRLALSDRLAAGETGSHALASRSQANRRRA